jgi:hypothetical protein
VRGSRGTERMIRTMTGPRQLVVYADSRHSVGCRRRRISNQEG